MHPVPKTLPSIASLWICIHEGLCCTVEDNISDRHTLNLSAFPQDLFMH